MSPALLIWFAALFLGLQPLTSDLYLPALPTLTQALGASMAQAQLTLSAMLLAFGISQLVWGPLSDRFGRRPVLLSGFALYSFSALASYTVSSIEQLILWRALQGVALGAVVMCARAMTRDVHAPQEAARLMSKGLSGLGVLAMLAVPVGSLAMQAFGWRVTIALPGVFSLIVLVVVWLKFVETNGRKNPQALQPQQLFNTWRSILSDPKFWTYALLALTSYAGLFVFLATSSFIFLQVLGQSKLFYSAVVAGMSVIYIAGTFVARRIMAARGVPRMVQLGAWITLLAALLFVGLYLLGYRSAWALALPHFVYMFGHGFHQPAGQAGCTAPFPQAAGAASAMAGFLMMLVAFATGAILGFAMDGSVTPMVFGSAFWSLTIVLIAWVLMPRYGQLS